MIAPPLPHISTPKTRAQSQTPPDQAANGPTPSQPVSIYTRQQAEIPMAPSVTFTEPSTSAGINPNDYLRFETNDVHIVQSVHSFRLIFVFILLTPTYNKYKWKH
jgi:hypothetical protein